MEVRKTERKKQIHGACFSCDDDGRLSCFAWHYPFLIPTLCCYRAEEQFVFTLQEATTQASNHPFLEWSSLSIANAVTPSSPQPAI